MEDSKQIGKIIKEYRTRAKVSQQQLELAINASFGSLSRIESGKVNPTKETLDKISKALKLSSEEKGRLFGIGYKDVTYEKPNSYIADYAENYMKVKYDSNTGIYSHRKFLLKGLKNGVSEFYYYHKDPNTLFKPNLGFKNNKKKYSKLSNFESWEGIFDGSNANISNRVCFPIRKIKEGEINEVDFELKSKSNFIEIIKNKTTPHYISSLMLCDTNKFKMEVEVPKGEKSTITAIGFNIEYMSKIIYEETFKFNNISPIEEIKNIYGIVKIIRNSNSINITWEISKKLHKFELIMISWFTDPLY